MSREPDRLEHLFSRYLDGECTPDERDSLETLIGADRRVRSLFGEYRRLDRAVGDALRQDLGRSRPITGCKPVPQWGRLGRGLAVAAAACLAALAWLQPTPPGGDAPTSEPGPAQAASWFAPLRPPADTIEPVPSAYERPELRLRGTQRDWIVIPGDSPGTYLVIEVDHVRTHVIAVHRDF